MVKTAINNLKWDRNNLQIAQAKEKPVGGASIFKLSCSRKFY